MRDIRPIPVAEIEPDPDNPRKGFDESELLSLGKDMAVRGQLVPVIVYELLAADAGVKRYRLLDGERRWRAAQLAALKTVEAVILQARLPPAELSVLQLSLDVQRVSLSLMERSNLIQRIRDEHQWLVGELAEKLNLKQPTVSRLLSYQKLDPSIQAQLHAGEIDGEKALILSQCEDHARQRELLTRASGLSREQLREVAKRPATPVAEVKAATATFALGGGVSLALKGKDLTLDTVIDALAEAVKELRRGQSQGLDIKTQQRVMADRAKAR